MEEGVFGEGLAEEVEVLVGGDFDGAEAGEVGGVGLGVEEEETAGAEAFDEGDEGDFGGVGFAVEHGLAEEGGVEGDAVEAADEFAVAPGFDGVCEAELVEPGVGGDELGGDPGAIVAVFHAAAHGAGEVGVEADFESALADALAEGAGDVEGVERQNAAGVGGVPADAAVPVGHGEDALGIGGEQGLGAEIGGGGHGGGGVAGRRFKRGGTRGKGGGCSYNKLTDCPLWTVGLGSVW